MSSVADANKDSVSKSRVVFVDPNSVNGSSDNGIEFSVPMEELSIGVDIIAEVRSRFGVETTTTVVSFVTGVDNKSLFEGTKLNSENDEHSFLTTFYTDIDFQGAKRKGTVEGLGLSSVDINFDSWYTPQVTMKFIDVRGSGLFMPNEYEKEVGNSEVFTSENMYKCFFTFPYPKFTLVVKGFYGKPVSYQLTCSNFTATFNSQTGNFEATASFIGYNYSLLTDIQLQYLVAAPYSTYYGRSYFNKHRYTERWLLDDGIPMPTLVELIDNIDKAGEVYEKLKNTSHTFDTNSKLNVEKDLLTAILSKYESFITAYDGFMVKCGFEVVRKGDGLDDTQLVYVKRSSETGITDERQFERRVINLYNDFMKEVFNYNDKYRSRMIPSRQIPNIVQPNLIDNPLIYDQFVKGYTTYDSLKELRFMNGCFLSALSIKSIRSFCDSRRDSVYKTVSLFDTKGFVKTVNEKIVDNEKRFNNIDNELALLIKEVITNSIKIKPSVYNISKVIFAHLETFLACIYQCDSNIRLSNRTFSDFQGWDIDMSDLAGLGSGNFVPPFPMYLTKQNRTTLGNGDTQLPVEGWIGDANPNAEEVKLINGLFEAVQSVEKDRSDERKEIDAIKSAYNFIPLLPHDLTENKSPFAYNLGNESVIHDIAYRLGNRATLLSNFTLSRNVPNDFARHAGEIDAYNYYLATNSRDKLKEILDGPGADGLIEIMKCRDETYATPSPNGNEGSFDFELNKMSEEYKHRNVVFNENVSGELTYSYLYTNERTFYPVSTSIDNYNQLKTAYKPDEKGVSVPYANGYINRSFVTLTDSDTVMESIADGTGETETMKERYINPYIFNIYTGERMMNILGDYEILSANRISVRDYEKDYIEGVRNALGVVKDTLWDASIEKYMEDFGKKNEVQVETRSSIVGVFYHGAMVDDSTQARMLYEYRNGTPILPSSFNEYEKLTSGIVRNENVNNESYKDSCKVLENVFKPTEYDFVKDVNGYDFSNSKVFMPWSLVYNYNKGGKKVLTTTFSHPFYYLQDNMYAKALIFLSGIRTPYSYKDYLKVFTDSKTDSKRIYRFPKLFLLMLGGVIWRKRYIDKNDKDCFVFSIGQNPKYTVIPEDSINIDGYFNIINEILDPSVEVEYANRCLYPISDDGENGRNARYKDIYSLRRSVSNALCSYFESWVKSDFTYLMNEYEIRLSDHGREKYGVEDGYSVNYTLMKRINSDWNSILNLSKRVLEDTDERGGVVSLRESTTDFLKSFSPNFLKNYGGFDHTKTGAWNLLFRHGTSANEKLVELYTASDIITFGAITIFEKDENEVAQLTKRELNVNRQFLKNYVEQFLITCKDIVDFEQKRESDEEQLSISSLTDAKIAMYAYLKTVYDKWLAGGSFERFKTDTFFDKNFIYVDSFFRNIGDKLIVNCDYISKIYYEMADTNTLFTFISDLYSKHGMIFTPMSNFNDWSDGNTMNEMFKPLSYNAAMGIRDENYFVCMYVHQPSKNLKLGGESSGYGYKHDGFDIYPVERQPEVFRSSRDSDDYAYPVPAFLVSFGKQNNAYFKNVNVGMSNPTTTEYSIKAIWEIAKTGGDNLNRIHFIGQDLYSVWSNYSYTCEVEMMGCSQIQPLMYFQLNNIPMFSGAYVITKVVHTIEPGNMTTRFTGVKLANHGQPFNTIPFGFLGALAKRGVTAVFDEPDIADSRHDRTDINGQLEGTTPFEPENVPSEDIGGDDCNTDNVYIFANADYCGLNEHMKRLYHSIRKSVENLSSNLNASEDRKWTVGISSGKRSGDPATSHHNAGNAIDFQIVRNGKMVGKGESKPELGILFSLIATQYSKYISELIIEYSSIADGIADADYIKTIHFACTEERYEKKGEVIGEHEVFQAYGNNDTNIADTLILNSETQMYDTEGITMKTDSLDIVYKDSTVYMGNVVKARSLLSNITNHYRDVARNEFANIRSNGNPNSLDRAINEFKKKFTSFRNASNDTLRYYFDFGVEDTSDKTRPTDLFCFDKLVKNAVSEGFPFMEEVFKEKLFAFCQERNFDPNWMMFVFGAECGFRFNNRTKSAYGLIQFTEDGIKDMGISMSQIMSCTPEEQLDYVFEYFKKWENDKGLNKETYYKNPVDVYTIVFCPNQCDGGLSETLYKKGTDAYNANKALDVEGKGYITKKDLQNFLFRQIRGHARLSNNKADKEIYRSYCGASSI